MYKGRIPINTMIELYEQGYEPDEIGHMYGYKNGEYIRGKLRDAECGRRRDWTLAK